MTTPPPPPAAQITLQNTQPLTFRAADGAVLSGELSLPVGAKPGQRFPTVVLLHGSGPNDLNETLPAQVAGVPGGSAVFLQLAQQLNSQGFAVVRFNKRGVLGVGPQVLPAAQRTGAAFTVSGYLKDALSVLNHTRTLSAVNPAQVYLLGHSEGTMLAASLARQHPQLVRGLVLIGTVGHSFRDTLHFQLVDRPLAQLHQLFDTDRDGFLTIPELLETFKKLGIPPASQADGLGLVPKGDSWVFAPSLNPDAQGRVNIDRDLKAHLEALFAPFPNLPGLPAQEVLYLSDAEKFGSVTTLLPGYQGPVLMLHGELDAQTVLDGARKALQAVQASGNTQAKLIVYPGLGHSLAPMKGGIPTLGPMEARPLNDLTDWLKQVSAK